MKLSELTTDGALDALCTITPYIYSITSDEEIITALGKTMPKKKKENKEGAEEAEKATVQEETDLQDEEDTFAFGVRMMNGLTGIAPLLLKTHRTDVYGILSVLNQRTVDEIAAQNAMETVRQIREATQDEELRSFFKSFAPSAKSEPSEPSAPSPA